MSMTVIVLFLVFFALLFLGVPLAVAIGTSALVAAAFTMDLPVVIIVQRMFTQFNSFTLMAIPLFVLTGQLMNTGGITRRIVAFSNTVIGHIRGGLSHVNVLASMLFAGVSGSATADAAGIGSILIPAMKEDGYEDDWAVVITAASSAIGPIIPPSILMVIYGVVTELSVGRLFLAGLVPGVLIGVSQIVTGYLLAIKRGRKPERERASLSEIARAFSVSWPPLLAPIIIIGGITAGVFTPTEAGAIAAAYAFVLCLFYKELTFKSFVQVLIDTAKASSVVYFIIGVAGAFGAIITIEQLPGQVVALLLSISTNPTVIILLVVVLMMIIGLFIDATTVILIFVPFLFPLANRLGIDPYHFATIIVVTLQIGGITPPVGILLYVACSVSGTPVRKVLRLPWLFVSFMLLVVLLMVFVPKLVTFFPSLMG
jgi:tripartite ATP-independent transporter DctM subunit